MKINGLPLIDVYGKERLHVHILVIVRSISKYKPLELISPR